MQPHRHGRTGANTEDARIQDGIVRIEYTAGMAAVREIQKDKDIVEDLVERLNTTPDKIAENVDRLNSELRDQKKRMDQFATVYTEMKAKQLAASATLIGNTRIVVHIAEGKEDPEQLSKMLSEMSNVIAVIGVKEKSAKVFVSKSADVEVDCRTALKEIMKLVGGGGGGRKEYATGGGGDPEKLHETFDKVPDILRTMCRR